MSAKYRYGNNANGDLQDVTSLDKSNLKNIGPFSCIGCGAPLIAKLGHKNIKHFSHESGDGCGKETYLHRLGKRFFIQTYSDCVKEQKPFFLALKTAIECTTFQEFLGGPCSYSRIEEYDLTKYFDVIAEEVFHDSFRPDVLLKSSKTGDVIFVEIAVYHKSSENKMCSGNRIIEYTIESENDVDRLVNTRLTEETPGVELVNFETKVRRGDFCDGNCEHYFDYFIVDRNGRASILHATPAELIRDVQSYRVVYSAPCPINSNKTSEFLSFMKTAIENGVKLRNCFMCIESESTNTSSETIQLRCRKHHKRITSSEAFRCRDYSPDRS